jgi:hypothetical protein
MHLSKKPQLNVMFENINTREFVKDITKMFLISFSKSEELKNEFLKDIWNNAINQAPSAIHKHIAFDMSLDQNGKNLLCPHKV